MGDESEKERVDRELIELMNELRVALPGVQVLFAFLLAVPFQARFDQTTQFQRWLYFFTLISAFLACAFMIAPSALHRFNFRRQKKLEIVFLSNSLVKFGLSTLALSLLGVVCLISELVFGTLAAVLSAVLGAALLGWLWFLLPRRTDLTFPD